MLLICCYSTDGMHSMHTMLRGNHLKDNYVLLAGENENFFELDLTSGDVYQKNEVENSLCLKAFFFSSTPCSSIY